MEEPRIKTAKVDINNLMVSRTPQQMTNNYTNNIGLRGKTQKAITVDNVERDPFNDR